MTQSLNLTAAALLLLVVAAPAVAGEFIGGSVDTGSASPPGSPLQIRARPDATAPSIGYLTHGDPISLTGPCRQFKPSGTLKLKFTIRTLTTVAANNKIHAPRTWCQVLFDSANNGPVVGWVNARFVDL